ncbi:MAG: DUF5723 family protein [Flavobacteriales bacterium]|nr:DUF5723 family protein [Flavobacteriales bacterium]
MKQLLLLALGVAFSATSALAQTENGAFAATGRGASTPFTTDYHALGINPANLSLPSRFENKSVTFGLFEGTLSTYSEFFTKDEVRKLIAQDEFEVLDQQQRYDYANSFAGQTTRVDIDLITSGVSVNMGNAGTIAFSTRERVDFSAALGPQLSELLFLGYASSYFPELILNNGDTIANTGNLSADTLALIDRGIVDVNNAMKFSEIVDGTSAGFSWIREFNLGYGKQILSTDDIALHVGVGGKLLVGNAWMQVDVDGSDVDVFSALSPVFGIDYDEIEGDNPSAFEADAPDLKPVGLGWGVDIGATLVWREKLHINAAVNDIGRMKWDGNLYELNDQLFTEFTDDGAETANIIEEIINFSSPESAFEWTGSSSRTTKLSTIARVGAGLRVHPKLDLAADAILPVTETVVSYDQPIISLGGDFRPVNFIQLSAGMITGNDEPAKIPVGLTFIVGKGTWEFGFASRDMITWFTEDNPTASLSWGFLRFRV